jgi:hypothetical protein
MYQEIIKLEDALNSLLPQRRLNVAPSQQLLYAALVWSGRVWTLSQKLDVSPLTPEQISQGKRLAENPVFICGVHRSGTTLLRDLLDGHPELSVLPSEGSFLTSLAPALKNMPEEKYAAFLATEWLRRLANPINQPPYWLLGRSAADRSPYVNFAQAFQTWYDIFKKDNTKLNLWPHLAVILAYATCSEASQNGLNAKYWVDKTPTNEKYLTTIWHETPKAKVIHMVRNPADVFLSRKQMEPRLNYKTCLQDMQLSYHVAERYRNDKRFLLVHYEALCDNPEAVISQICEFLDIKQLTSLFTPTVAGKQAVSNSSFSADLPAGSILKGGPVTGEKHLDKKVENLLSAFLYEQAKQLGYELNDIGKMQGELIKLRTSILSRIA